MEDTHRAVNVGFAEVPYSLNPCSNGRYSQSLCYKQSSQSLRGGMVLILVLMEDTHREDE